MSLTTRIHESREVLTQEGQLLVSRTRSATQRFLKQTRKAGQSLVKSSKKAGSELVEETTGASLDFVKAVRSEATAWQSFLATASKTPVLRAVEPRELKLLVSVDDLEQRVLKTVRTALDQIGGHVDQRLQSIAAATGPKKPKSEKATDAPPISGYAKLSAKAIVEKLEGLPQNQVEAVLQYERKTKNRATILKAAEEHLAA